MIGFVTWPPFLYIPSIYKGGQVTKSIIVVKMSCELLYVYVTRFAKGGLIRAPSQCTDLIHHHSIATLINKQCMYAWMPTAHRSAFLLWLLSEAC